MASGGNWGAVLLVGKLKSPQSLSILKEALCAESSIVRQYAALGFAELGDGSVIPILMDRIQNDNFEVRTAIVEALGKLGGTNTARTLEDMYHNLEANALYKVECRKFMCKVMIALGEIGDDLSLDFIIDEIKNRNRSLPDEIITEAIDAISKFKNDKAFDTLVEELTENSNYKAATCLHYMNDPRADQILACVSNSTKYTKGMKIFIESLKSRKRD